MERADQLQLHVGATNAPPPTGTAKLAGVRGRGLALLRAARAARARARAAARAPPPGARAPTPVGNIRFSIHVDTLLQPAGNCAGVAYERINKTTSFRRKQIFFKCIFQQFF